PALAERSVVGGPIRRAVAGGFGLAHAIGLTAWIRDVNPPPREFCNNALPYHPYNSPSSSPKKYG
ncbi:MAG: hypothetical protein ABJ050_18345, partial [Paracoccaceae bacterium]